MGAEIHILVVEDNELDVERVRRLVRRVDVDVDVQVSKAKDGQAALEALQDADAPLRPDLILVDQNMPRLHGVGFIDEAKRLGLPLPEHLVGLTTSDLDVDREEFERAGARDVFVKPITKDQVEALLRDVVKAKSRRSEA